jgi:hypothetical protein
MVLGAAIAEAFVNVRPRTDGFKQQTEAEVGGAFQSAARMGKFALIGLAGAVALAAGPLMNLSRNMELMGAKAATVFGDQLGSVQKWAGESAAAMGLSSAKAVGLAASFADLLIPMGFTRQQAADMSTGVVGLSGALAEWSGGTRTAAEVSQILAKAMLGEREQLKELGISITEADVQQRLFEKGQQDLTGAQLQQAKATATQELIFEKSTDAQAAYATGGDTLARQQSELRATLDTVKEQIATALIPVFKAAISIVGDAVSWFKEHETVAKTLGITLGVVLVGLIGAYIISMIGAAAATIAATWPILAIIAAIAALVWGVQTLLRHFGVSWEGIKDVVASAASFIGSRIGSIVGAFGSIGAAIAAVIGWVQRFIDKLRSIRLPSWLDPGSPSPFEKSLKNTVGHMRDLVRATPDELGFAGRPAAFAGGYRAATIVVEIDGRQIIRAVGQPLVDSIRVKTAHRR